MFALGSSAIGMSGVISAVVVLLALAMLSIRIDARIVKRTRTPSPAYAYIRHDRGSRRMVPPLRYW